MSPVNLALMRWLVASVPFLALFPFIGRPKTRFERKDVPRLPVVALANVAGHRIFPELRGDDPVCRAVCSPYRLRADLHRGPLVPPSQREGGPEDHSRARARDRRDGGPFHRVGERDGLRFLRRGLRGAGHRPVLRSLRRAREASRPEVRLGLHHDHGGAYGDGDDDPAHLRTLLQPGDVSFLTAEPGSSIWGSSARSSDI